MRKLWVGSAMVLALCGQGVADFSGVVVRDVSADVCTPLGLQTVRLYATFTDRDHQLRSVGAFGDDMPDFLLALEGGELVNDPESVFAGIRAEDFPSVPFGAPWDSYVAIGADTFFESEAQFSQGFAGGDSMTSVIRGDLVEEDDGGWFDSGLLTPVTGSEILIAQLTFDPKQTAGFIMEGGVAWRPTSTGTLQFTPFAVEGTSCTGCRTDLDHDGITGLGDLLMLLSAWGDCGQLCCPSDLDGSGSTDLADLLHLLVAWSAECDC